MCQTGGDLAAGKGVNPIKVLGDWPRLVRLDGANIVPLQSVGVCLAEGQHLVQRLLQIILTEVALACGECCLEVSNRTGFADCQQRDRIGTSIVVFGQFDDLLPDSRQIRSNGLVMMVYRSRGAQEFTRSFVW